MRINHQCNINIPQNNNVSKDNKSQIKEQQIIETEGSSLNGLAIQGMAQINISDKEISDEKFEILKKNFYKKLKLKSEDIQNTAQKWTLNKHNIKIATKILDDENNFVLNSIICKYVNNAKKEKLANKILDNTKYYENDNVFPYISGMFILLQNNEQINLAEKILSNETFYNNENFMKNFSLIIATTNTKEKAQIANDFLDNKTLQNNKIFLENAATIILKSDNLKKMEQNLKLLNDKEFTPTQILCKIDNPNLNDNLKKINKLLDKNIINKFSFEEMKIIAMFIDLYNKNNIEALPIKTKKELLHNLTIANSNLFDITKNLKSMFPLIPSNKEEYCNILPLIVHSLNENKLILSNDKINKFNENLNKLSLSLKNISDSEFDKLEITQEYTKNDFILNVLNELKDLEEQDKKEIFDYFGFELQENSNTVLGYSIKGYPVAKKDIELQSKNKDIIENIQNYIIKFNENNRIICSNQELEENLNNIIEYIPELRTTIGNLQAGMNGTIGSHKFDIFKHSLKVIQGIVNDKEYNNLNNSDKKIIILSALLHDITKKEGYIDSLHAENSALDSLFITKRFNLKKDEEAKLYKLIKYHEWLGFVNRSGNKSELEKRLQYTAYDLRHDNIFEMSLIFTHADLKGVNDNFHDSYEGFGKTDFNGITRSFGEAADYHSEKIKNYIYQLKSTQPILPVTKIPKVSTIEKAVTIVNNDGSTNIKGIYKDKDGLIIIKYNELENDDLEKIGFPKNSKVKGIHTITDTGQKINTGNIKFFVHGLDFPNQLIKFNSFSFIDSDALLSVSYSECPETKFKFYRTQGVILDCDTRNIHGGGDTDSGSGNQKNIDKFKSEYLFGSERTKDRNYVSDLIKKTLDFNDEQYIDFVKQNENKSMAEIEPEELRCKLIKAFSSINSSIRNGERAYNEMYISNPKLPMAVFAYSVDKQEKNINPIEFLNRNYISSGEQKSFKKLLCSKLSVKERTEFLRKYAIDNNLPFIIFGD